MIADVLVTDTPLCLEARTMSETVKDHDFDCVPMEDECLDQSHDCTNCGGLGMLDDSTLCKTCDGDGEIDY